MEYLEKNLEKLRKYRKYFYEKLIDIMQKGDLKYDRFNILTTRDGDKTIEITVGNERHRLNSLYSPKKEAERWADKYKFNNINTSVVMFGIANGVFARAILDKLKKDAVFFLVEPDLSLFVYCLKNFDMRDIISDARVHFFVDTINYEDIYFSFLNTITEVMLPNQFVCTYPEMDRIYGDKAQNFMEIIKNCYGVQLSLGIDFYNVYEKTVYNTFKNLHFIKGSNYLTEFIGKIPDEVPVIIVSAGPSLDKNVDDLKKAEKKAFIVATDTAVKTLIAHDVPYDVIITKDVKKSAIHLKDERCHDHPMIADICSKNSILEENKGHKIWNNTSNFMCRLYAKYGLKYTSCMLGMSVATDAFTMAELISAKRIILIGQDLAYAGEYSHAGSVANHSYDNINGIYEIEGIYGDKVKARGDWVDMIHWFEAEIAKVRDDIDVIDATEGGAKIQGTRIMKLSEAIELYCKKKFDFQEVLNQMQPTFSEDMYEKLREDLYNMKKELSDIYSCSEEGIKAADDMLLLLDGQETQQADIKLGEKAEIVKKNMKFIEEQLVYEIINDYMETKIKSALKINMLGDDRAENAKFSCELSKEAFNAAIETVDYAMPILQEALESI